MDQAKKGNNINAKKLSAKELDFLDLAEKMLADLPERSTQIVRRRFGLMLHPGETLEKIGQRYGITR